MKQTALQVLERVSIRPGDFVHVDGDKSWSACVEGILVRTGDYVQAEIAWISGGVHCCVWISVSRLTLREKR